MEQFELRAFPMKVLASSAKKLGGYAAVFDSPSEDLGGFTEYIRKGAFSESLQDRADDILMAWAHDLSKPIASRNAGSLTLREDNTGLAFEAALNDTSWARDAYEAIQSGAISKVSFMFRVRPGGETWQREGGKDIRIVTAARLFEISPVAFPAYSDTSVVARSARSAVDILAGRPALKDLERMKLEIKRRGIC
jgi:uncharacterized protein